MQKYVFIFCHRDAYVAGLVQLGRITGNIKLGHALEASAYPFWKINMGRFINQEEMTRMMLDAVQRGASASYVFTNRNE